MLSELRHSISDQSNWPNAVFSFRRNKFCSRRRQANPIGAAAGVANLKLIDSLGLVNNARETGAYFNLAMTESLGSHPHVGDVRGDGLLCAAEFVEGKNTRTFYDSSKKIGVAVAAAPLKCGVIGRAMPQDDILGFSLPLCLTQSEADERFGKTNQAVNDVPG